MGPVTQTQRPEANFDPFTSRVHGKGTKKSIRISDHYIFKMELEGKVIGHAEKGLCNKFNLKLQGQKDMPIFQIGGLGTPTSRFIRDRPSARKYFN